MNLGHTVIRQVYARTAEFHQGETKRGVAPKNEVEHIRSKPPERKGSASGLPGRAGMQAVAGMNSTSRNVLRPATTS